MLGAIFQRLERRQAFITASTQNCSKGPSQCKVKALKDVRIGKLKKTMSFQGDIIVCLCRNPKLIPN